MSRPIQAFVDLRALRNNLAVARRHAESARILAVVKADAYGHGLHRLLPALSDLDGLAVVEFESAVRIRSAGFHGAILLLEGFFGPRELEQCAELSLSTVIHAPMQVDMLARTKLARPIDVFVKLNTGMNRLGFPPEALREVVHSVRTSGNVRAVIAMTHFADADGSRGVDWQLERLFAAVAPLKLPICTANSAALLRYPQARGDWVRPGIMLYGASPFPEVSAAALGLEPVMTLRSSIIGIRELVPGDCVGYGCVFKASKPLRLGVVACGYGDGYPRHAETGTPVLVDGVRVGTVGRVSMDTLCVDLSETPGAGVGSKVTLWGMGLPVEEVAASAGTVSYELLCRLTQRVPVAVVGTEQR